VTIEIPVLMTIAATGGGALVWLVRLEGRINMADERHLSIKADLVEIKSSLRAISVMCPLASGREKQDPS